MGFIDGGRPVVLPVNYAMDGRTPVFRTAPGAKHTAALRSGPAVLEIDDADPIGHTGWSVLVHGHLEEVTDPAERDRLMRLPVRPWAPGDKDHVIRLVPDRITGRRLVRVAHREP